MYSGRYFTIKNQLLNEEINLPKVRLIGTNNEQLGIMSSKEALAIAEEQNLDLVLMSPNAEPPVCKIIDYGKFKFDQAKKLKEQRKAQKTVEIKEIQLSMTIEKHDIDVKAKHAQKFLSNGDKVKVTIRMKGRQQARPEMGIEVMNTFFEVIKDFGVIEKAPEIMGRNIFMILAPIKTK
ncbi:MAG: translation initiation factor IF-3 [Clostridia bacterium]|nr:translation initiation factor IF-3 [Clostridia bacterium]